MPLDRTPPSKAMRRSSAIDLVGFVAVHILAVAGVAVVGVSTGAVVVAVGSYAIRCWGVVAGFHRYFSHRTYRLGRLPQFAVAVLGTLAMQKGVLWWASTHRAHHASADTERDPHSPHHRSFWYSHCGWLFDPGNQSVDHRRIRDLSGYPELVWLQRQRSVPVLVYAIGLWALFGPQGFVWGFGVASVALWHSLLATGSFSHRLGGYRNFDIDDDSRNSRIISALLLGDGWHNNHHRSPTSARQGLDWTEPDPIYWSLRALQAVGIASDLRDTLPSRPERAHRAAR